MEQEPNPNSNLVNYEMALRNAIIEGYITEDDADLAMQAFIRYEFGDLIDELKPYQPELPYGTGTE